MRRAADVLVPGVAWIGPWVVFFAVGAGSVDLLRFEVAVAFLVAANLFVLFGVLLRKRTNVMPRPFLFAGFVLTLAALVGSYACIDLAASHAYTDCYTSGGGTALTLGRTDAVYYAISTLTTAGFGDISAHSTDCRGVTITELAIGFPVLGLAVAAVAARLFQDA
jgi:hypothetical protein